MDKKDYTPEEIKDIQERVEKAQKMLQELHLSVMAQVVSVNMGDDIFALKVMPYLQDNKFIKEPIKSPFPKIS